MSTAVTAIYPEVKIRTFVANPVEGDIDVIVSEFEQSGVPGWRVLPQIRKNGQWGWDGVAHFYTSLDQIVTDLKAGKFSQ